MTPPATARPLLISTDPALLDDVRRLAAFAGVDMTVVGDADQARQHWRAAACVLVGGDAVAGCTQAGPPPRSDVVVLTRTEDPLLWRQALELGAGSVSVLPAAEEHLLELICTPAEPAPGPGAVVAVVGGCGGAGATTLACGLAVTAVRAGAPALLVDADPLGPGVDLVLGGPAAGGARWPDLATARGRLPAGALVPALPRVARVPVLVWASGDRPDLPAAAMVAVLTAGRRSGHVVVVDVPRAFDEASRAALSLADVVLLVVPAELRAVVAATGLLGRLVPLSRGVRLVVRGPTSPGVTAAEVAAALGVPPGAYLRPERGLSGRVARGQPPGRRRGGPLTRMCSALVEELVGPGAVAGR